jgi:hypothetical protein
MKKNSKKISLWLPVLFGGALICSAGTELKWADVPEVVRAAVLANGGMVGQTVDRENQGHNVDSQTVYEASVKDKTGNGADIVIKADGTLVETKHDDAADAAVEKADAAKKVFAGVKFSHPRDLTNPYLPLASLKQDVLEGAEDGKKVRVERTALPDKHKFFKIAGQKVDAAVFEDRAWLNGELEEVATDYFAQDDDGNIYYLGEDVYEYTGGKLTGHDGAWLLGKDTKTPGLIMPAHPHVGDQFKSEDVSKEISESDEIVSLSETVTVPAGTYQNCLKIAEHPAGEDVEYKYYAPGVGVVREVPAGGDEQLVSHATK